MNYSKLFTGINVGSILGTGVTSIIGTTYANDILKSSKEVKKQIKLLKNGDIALPEDIKYSDADYKKDIFENRLNTIKKMSFAYFPAVLFAVSGVANAIYSYISEAE